MQIPVYLQAHLHPVQLGLLEEFGALQSSEEALLLLILGRSVVQLVEDISLQQLLVAHPHFYWVVLQLKKLRKLLMLLDASNKSFDAYFLSKLCNLSQAQTPRPLLSHHLVLLS